MISRTYLDTIVSKQAVERLRTADRFADVPVRFAAKPRNLVLSLVASIFRFICRRRIVWSDFSCLKKSDQEIKSLCVLCGSACPVKYEVHFTGAVKIFF
jgi:hypothetical protein